MKRIAKIQLFPFDLTRKLPFPWLFYSIIIKWTMGTFRSHLETIEQYCNISSSTSTPTENESSYSLALFPISKSILRRKTAWKSDPPALPIDRSSFISLSLFNFIRSSFYFHVNRSNPVGLSWSSFFPHTATDTNRDSFLCLSSISALSRLSLTRLQRDDGLT